MRLLCGIAVVMGLMAGPVMAEGGAGALPADVPEKTLKRMRTAPDAFLADAADLILGFGQDQGIDAAGIDRAIAVERAAARAGTMRRLIAGDLDADGAVSADEIAVLVQAQAADGRGKALLGFEAADADADGAVSGAEIAAGTAKAGEEAVSPAKAAALRGLMTLDLNGDGTLALDEVREAVQRAAEAV